MQLPSPSMAVTRGPGRRSPVMNSASPARMAAMAGVVTIFFQSNCWAPPISFWPWVHIRMFCTRI